MPFRAGEELDAGRLAPYLAGKMPGAEGPLEIWQFGGGGDGAATRNLPGGLIDTLVDFHGVEPARGGLEGLGKPDGFLARQVRGWTERWGRARTPATPAGTGPGLCSADRQPPYPVP